ncbi:MAG: hypothetical protein GXX92_06680 [Clostridiales bacterium]|jgi:hypothetical protein|nr:hypothetical protein [Clostridiales bacterium]
MSSTESDKWYGGVHFTEDTHKVIQNGQRPTNHGHNDPGPQYVMAALNTIKTIVAIWQKLKSPVVGGIKKRGETYG